MKNEKQYNSEKKTNSEICAKCNQVLYEKYGIYYCATPECMGGFMLPSTRKIAKETIDRVRSKHEEYINSEKQIPSVLNDPYYEGFLKAFTDFRTIALFIEKDLNAVHHSNDFYTAKHYLKFFQAAEHFEKMLDDWKIKKEEKL